MRLRCGLRLPALQGSESPFLFRGYVNLRKILVCPYVTQLEPGLFNEELCEAWVSLRFKVPVIGGLPATSIGKIYNHFCPRCELSGTISHPIHEEKASCFVVTVMKSRFARIL